MRNAAFLCAVSGMIGLYGALASAESPDEQALSAYESGKTAFSEKRYIESANDFRTAYELKPSWKIFYNIGQAEAAGKRYGLALEAFEKYLAEGGDEVSTERQGFVMKEVVRLRNLVGYFKVTTEDDAEVVIDEVKRGVAPLHRELPVAASVPHVVRASIKGTAIGETTLQVGGGRTVEVTLLRESSKPENAVVTPEPAATPENPTPNATLEEDAPGISPLKLSGWIAVGVGGALLVGGAVTGGLALSKEQELSDDCSDGVCPAGYDFKPEKQRDRLALTTDILIPTGAVVAAAGVGILIWAAVRGDETAKSAGMTIHPLIMPSRGGLVLEGRF